MDPNLAVALILLFSCGGDRQTQSYYFLTSSPEQEQELAAADNRCTRLKSPSDLFQLLLLLPLPLLLLVNELPS